MRAGLKLTPLDDVLALSPAETSTVLEHISKGQLVLCKISQEGASGMLGVVMDSPRSLVERKLGYSMCAQAQELGL